MRLPPARLASDLEEPVEYLYPVPLPAELLHPMLIPLINGVIAPLAAPFGWYMGDWQPEMHCFVGPVAIHMELHGSGTWIKMTRGPNGTMLGLDSLSIERLDAMFVRMAMLTIKDM